MLTFLVNIFRTFTRTERLVFFGTCLTIAVAAGILGVLIFHSATIETPAPSPLYAEGVIGQPIALNPVLSGSNDADRDMTRLIFSDLMSLSESYKTDSDNRTWNIILKDNLRWSDGKPMTTDDVVFTIEAIQNSESRSPLSLSWQGVIVNRISEREIEFTLRTPYVFFHDNLSELFPIPKHIWGQIPIANFRLSQFNLEPVGSGPYKYSSFEKRNDGFITAYHLVTNPYFDQDKPFINEFAVKFYQNQSALIDAFNSRQIDGFGGINPKNINDIKLGNTLLEKTMPRYYAIFLNKNTPGLNDQNVISAMQIAIDKQDIINKVLDGKAIIVNEPILPITEGYDKNADPGNQFSPDNANALLEKSGWKLNDSGVRQKSLPANRQAEKRATSLEFSLIVPEIQLLINTANLIKQDMKNIGITINLTILNPTDIVAEVIKNRDYQMILFGNILKQNPDLFSFWHSSEKFYPGLNLSLYENKKVDTLLETIRKTPNADQRAKYLSSLQQLIAADMPALFLYSPTYLYVTPSHFGGFNAKTISIPSDRFQNVNKWYLATTRVFNK